MSGTVLDSESIKMNKEYVPYFVVNFVLTIFFYSSGPPFF